MPTAQFLGGFQQGINAHARMLQMRAQQQDLAERRAMEQEREHRIAQEQQAQLMEEMRSRAATDLTDLFATQGVSSGTALDAEAMMAKRYAPVWENMSPSERIVFRETAQRAGQMKQFQYENARNEALRSGITTEQAVADATYRARVGRPEPYEEESFMGYAIPVLSGITDLPETDRQALFAEAVQENRLIGGTLPEAIERFAKKIDARQQDYQRQQSEARAERGEQRAEASAQREAQRFEVAEADRPFVSVLQATGKEADALMGEIKAMEKTVQQDDFGGFIVMDSTGQQVLDPDEESRAIGEYTARLHKLRRLHEKGQVYQQIEQVRASGGLVQAIQAAASMGLSKDDPYVLALKQQYENAK